MKHMGIKRKSNLCIIIVLMLVLQCFVPMSVSAKKTKTSATAESQKTEQVKTKSEDQTKKQQEAENKEGEQLQEKEKSEDQTKKQQEAENKEGEQLQEKEKSEDQTKKQQEAENKEGEQLQEKSKDQIKKQQEAVKQTEEEMIEQILGMNPEDAMEPVTKLPEYPSCQYETCIDFSQDRILSGFFDTKSHFFKVKDYWKCAYAYAEIEFSLSQLIQGDEIPASLTFSVNHIPVYSCKIDYNQGKNQIIYVNIPLDLLNEGFNSFDMTGYVRIYDEEGCIDDLSNANWVNIKKTSFLRIGYDAIDDEQLISYYPYPFISSMDSYGEQSVVLVPEQAWDGELAAALLIRADLGDETEQEDHITFARYSDLTIAEKSRIVLVSTLDHLPSKYRALLPDHLEDLTNQAAILSVRDDEQHSILLVLSNNDENLMEAAMLLLDEDRVDQEDTSITYVEKGTAEIVRQSLVESDLRVQDYTIEELTGSGLSYVGPFHRSIDLQLPNTSGITLIEPGKISLDFRYSENLDFDRSLITVYWQDVPAASKKLKKENAGGDTLTFSMPTDVIGTSATKLTVTFDLEIKELYCSHRVDEMPWAYVTKDSSIYLPMGESEVASFDVIPYPFMMRNMYHKVCVVIPDIPTALELNLLGQIAKVYGAGITSYGELKVIRASEFDSKDSDYNMITIGSYKDNSFLKTINEYLSFQYEEEGNKYASNKQQILSDEYSRRIGILQMIQSPYANNRLILAVTGVNDDGLSRIQNYIKVQENVWDLTKDAVILDADGEMKSYQFLKQHKKGTKLGLKTFFEKNKNSLLFALVATLAMLILLIATILFALRIYIQKKDKKKKRKDS